MSAAPPVFESAAAPAELTTLTPTFRQGAPRLFILVSGALAISGTSSAEPNRVWHMPDEQRVESTESGLGWELSARSGAADRSSVETTQQAMGELRRLSGLTWDQLGQLFSVSRRSVHFWASGKPLNAANEARLLRVLDIVRDANRGDARSTRGAIMASTAGVVPFDLLVEQRFDEARVLLGAGSGAQWSPRTPLSAKAQALRRPPPPEEVVDAAHDRIHEDAGRGRAARTVRNKSRGRG